MKGKKKTVPVRKEGSGQFNGSVGQGARRTPEVAPSAGTGVCVETVVGERPNFGRPAGMSDERYEYLHRQYRGLPKTADDVTKLDEFDRRWEAMIARGPGGFVEPAGMGDERFLEMSARERAGLLSPAESREWCEESNRRYEVQVEVARSELFGSDVLSASQVKRLRDGDRVGGPERRELWELGGLLQEDDVEQLRRVMRGREDSTRFRVAKFRVALLESQGAAGSCD